MKLVTAIVRPEKLSDVLEALFRAEVTGLSISRVQGHGGETEAVETYRGTTVKMELVEKVRLEIGVSDSFVDVTVDAILAAARTGEVGDGKIFVLPVERVVRIRTGETDIDAVTPVAAAADLLARAAHRGAGSRASHQRRDETAEITARGRVAQPEGPRPGLYSRAIRSDKTLTIS